MPNPTASTEAPLKPSQKGTQPLRAQPGPSRTVSSPVELATVLSFLIFPFISLLGIAIAEGLGILA